MAFTVADYFKAHDLGGAHAHAVHGVHGSAPRGATMPTTVTIGNVMVKGYMPIIPAPGGIYDIKSAHKPGAYFTVQGVRQHKDHHHPAPSNGGIGLPMMKCKYDPYENMLKKQEDDRETEFLERYVDISSEASSLLSEKYARRNELREAESKETLMLEGLTEAEADDVLRKRHIERVTNKKTHHFATYSQQQKNIIHKLAEGRGIHIGLPQSTATFTGKSAPRLNFSRSEVSGVRRVIDRLVHNEQALEEHEAMIGQVYPKENESGMSHLDRLRAMRNAGPGGVTSVIQPLLRSSLPPSQTGLTRNAEGVISRKHDFATQSLAGAEVRPMSRSREFTASSIGGAEVRPLGRSRNLGIQSLVGPEVAPVMRAEAQRIREPPGTPPAELVYDRSSLQSHLRELREPTTGTTAELRARLEEALKGSASATPPGPPPSRKLKK